MHTLKSHSFRCVTPTGVGGSDELAPDTRPNPKKPDKPVLTVVDPPLICTNGIVKDGACVCVRTHKPVKAGWNAWRCMKTVVIDPPKTGAASSLEQQISCTHGAVSNGACTCARAHKPVLAGKNAWRCVNVVVSDPPNKGSAHKLEVESAPRKTANPKNGGANKAGRLQGRNGE